MKTTIIIILITLLTSCGKIEVEDSNHTTSTSGRIDIVLDLGLDDLNNVFKDACQNDPLNDTTEKVDSCIATE